jgi:hypothetical protein
VPEPPAPGAAASSAVLDQLARLRRTARVRARGGWIPLVVFALLTLASMVLYSPPFIDVAELYSPEGLEAQYTQFAGLPGNERSTGLSIGFWLLLAPLSYLACLLAYRRRAGRHGVSLRWQAWMWTGLALFALLLLTLLVPIGRPAAAPQDFQVLTPLLPIGLGLLALAWVERSATIAVAAALYTWLAAYLATNGLGTVPLPVLGLTSWDSFYGAGPNLILLAAILLAGAGVDAALGARAVRRALAP